MPHHYPEDQSLENLKKVRRNNVCLVCGRELYAYLGLDKKVYIACSSQVHEGITREYKPPGEDYQSNIRRSIEMEQKVGTDVARTIGHIPQQGQLTQPQAMTILKLQYPGASEDEIVKTAIFCRDFGLHPLANEVYLIPFKKKWKDEAGKWHEEERHVMVVGIPASRKIAHARKGQFSFLDDTPRAATEEEIVRQYGKDSEEGRDNIISITKLQGEGGNLAIGFGLYPKNESPYGMDKGNTRRNMANIRSERQGMDRLPGKPLPHYEVADTAFVEGVGEVDKKTGVIIEGEVVEEVTVDEIPQPKEEPEPRQPKAEEDKDESPVTKEEAAELKDLVEKVGMTPTEIGSMMAKDLKWAVPKTFQDLKKWQMTTLMEILNKELKGK